MGIEYEFHCTSKSYCNVPIRSVGPEDPGFIERPLLYPGAGKKVSLARREGIYTGCPRRNVPDFGRVFLMLNYTDITQNTYIQS